MQCSNRECGATVDDGVQICPQCGTAIEPSVQPNPSEEAPHDPEALAKASRHRRVRFLANASLLLAILSCPLLWATSWHLIWTLLNAVAVVSFIVLASLAAIVAGHMAIALGKRVPRTGGRSWRPLLGTVFGYLNLVLLIVLMAAFITKGRLNADMAACYGNLGRIQMVLRQYADQHQGMFPPLSSQPGVLMFSAEAIPPTDGVGPLPLTCPTIRHAKPRTAGQNTSDKPASAFDDQSYFYLGYAVLNDDAVEAFAKAYRKKMAEGGTFDENLVVEDGKETHVLHRLSKRVREVLRASQDPLSVSPYEGQDLNLNSPLAVCDDVPLLIERDVDHVYNDWDGPPHGAHVLYLNAGLQFVERGTWPMTEKTQRILAELGESAP